MKCVVLLALVGLCLGVSGAVRFPTPEQRATMHLLEMMMQSQSLGRASSQVQECFEYYNPILASINEEYETTYAGCEDTATKAREDVDASTMDTRTQLEQIVDESYAELSSCKGNADSILYFECYESAAQNGSKVLYGVSLSAADALVEVREAFRLINNTETQCKEEANREYYASWSATTTDLQNCLAGSPLPNNTPSTEPPTPEPTTTTPETTPDNSPETPPPTTTPEPSPTEDPNTTTAVELPEEDIGLRGVFARFRGTRHH